MFPKYFSIKNLTRFTLYKRCKNCINYRFKYVTSLVFCLSVFILGCSHVSRDERYSSSKQFDKVSSSFHNSNGSKNSKSFFDFLSFLQKFILRTADPFEKEGFPWRKPDLHLSSEQPSVTWIGHSTLLVRFHGKTILTDPIFSTRASPFSIIGPKRVVPPALSLHELPPIDFVVISHSHYDHLDLKTIKELAIKRKNTVFFVPLGLRDLLEGVGARKVFELDWWDEIRMDDITFIATPAHHWSARSLLDRNKSLWASWMVVSQHFRFWFAGDTGYSNDFTEIRKRVGEPDLAAIPIGAYSPRSFMKNAHVNPGEAVDIFLDLGAKKAVAIHWGTFKLSTELLAEPPKKLQSALEAKNISEDLFKVLGHGETLFLD